MQAATEDERQLFMQLARMLIESDQAEARIAALSVRLDAVPEDRFALYLLGSLHHGREEFALGGPPLRELARLEPENAKVVGLFFVNCLGAGDDCPPLWPEKRDDRPEITCDEAIEFDGIVHPETLEPLENINNLGPLEKGTSFNEVLQDPERSWIVASAAYMGATIVQMDGGKENEAGVAQAIILYDTIMECFPDSEGTRYYREYTRSQSAQEMNGEPVFFQDLYFHENLRQNRLDLAWEVLDYRLGLENNTDED
mgnify:CR=1 FL=1